MHIASGRVEGFWEEYLKPWDTAAGVLIAREAGAVVTDFSGTHLSPPCPRNPGNQRTHPSRDAGIAEADREGTAGST